MAHHSGETARHRASGNKRSPADLSPVARAASPCAAVLSGNRRYSVDSAIASATPLAHPFAHAIVFSRREVREYTHHGLVARATFAACKSSSNHATIMSYRSMQNDD